MTFRFAHNHLAMNLTGVAVAHRRTAVTFEFAHNHLVMNLTGVAVAEVNGSPFRGLSRLSNLMIEGPTCNRQVACEVAS